MPKHRLLALYKPDYITLKLGLGYRFCEFDKPDYTILFQSRNRDAFHFK